MKIVDLFAGSGGFSLGFKEAGFETVFALEKDLWAAETFAHNNPHVKVYTRDITLVKRPCALLLKSSKVDGIIGGPPCQGFSLSGDRDPKDPRNSLFMEYLRFVSAYGPKFFVMENVTGILSAKTAEGRFVKDLIRIEAERAGYNVALYKLNAVDFGVPQSRTRVFFIGIRKDFPINSRILSPIATYTHLQRLTILDGISDLPVLESGEGSESMEYPLPPQNKYQAWCRANSNTVRNHISMRHTARIVSRFNCIKFGQSLANVSADHMQRKRGDVTTISGKSFAQNNMRPYPDQPSPTIPASFQSNFIHPLFNRNYTAREGARLQSFPDNYEFMGKRTTMSWEKHLSQYQQIGNAVPPLLAKAIALSIAKYFSGIKFVRNDQETSFQLDLFNHSR